MSLYLSDPSYKQENKDIMLSCGVAVIKYRGRCMTMQVIIEVHPANYIEQPHITANICPVID